MNAKNDPAAKKVAKKTAAPALDFGKLTVVDSAEALQPKREASSAANHFVPFVKESAEQRTDLGQRNGVTRWRGKTKTVTVPSANETQVVNLIRAAAGKLGFGAAVETRKAPGGNVQILFCAQNRKQPRKTETASDATNGATNGSQA